MHTLVLAVQVEAKQTYRRTCQAKEKLGKHKWTNDDETELQQLCGEDRQERLLQQKLLPDHQALLSDPCLMQLWLEQGTGVKGRHLGRGGHRAQSAPGREQRDRGSVCHK